jgi:hypothetical protein
LYHYFNLIAHPWIGVLASRMYHIEESNIWFLTRILPKKEVALALGDFLF